MIACKNDKKLYLHEGKSYYLPFEHTICISKQWIWFQKSEPVPVRDLDELEELFYWCTDNDNTLIIDIAPDNKGLIREHEANAAIALAKRIGIQYGKPLPKNGKNISFEKKAKASNVYNNETEKWGAWAAVDGALQSRWATSDTLADLAIELNPNDKFNKISIFEYQDRKSGTDKTDFFSNFRFNRIQAYTIDILKGNEWLTIYRGDEPMGDCKLIRFPNYYSTSKIRLKVLKANAPPSIWEFNVIEK
jgi:alpha-L-fucosidase